MTKTLEASSELIIYPVEDLPKESDIKSQEVWAEFMEIYNLDSGRSKRFRVFLKEKFESGHISIEELVTLASVIAHYYHHKIDDALPFNVTSSEGQEILLKVNDSEEEDEEDEEGGFEYHAN